MLSKTKFQALMLAASKMKFISRAWLLDALTVTNSMDHAIPVSKSLEGTEVWLEDIASFNFPFGPGNIIGLQAMDGMYIGEIHEVKEKYVSVFVLGKSDQPAFKVTDVFDPGDFDLSYMVKQMIGVNPFTDSLITGGRTTVGRFIENMVCYQYPIGFTGAFEYENKVLDPEKVFDHVTEGFVQKRITVEQYKKFIDYFYFLNHITEIAVPSMTVRSLTTDPRIPEIKAKFIKEHEGQMHDPLVIKQLEDLLKEVDMNWLNRQSADPDPSVIFFDGLGKKSWDIHRKKLFLTTGGIPAFEEQSGNFDFIPNSLMEGWTPKAIPSIANESRKGSYERGRETAKGGAETKLVMRVFQDLLIDNDDCGTTRTTPIDFSDGMCRVKDFIGRTVREGEQDVVITEDNMKQFEGRKVNMYSPMTCATPHNLCYKCCGRRAKDLGADVVGIQVIKITSKFMLTSMKNMHGTVLQVVNTPLERMFL